MPVFMIIAILLRSVIQLTENTLSTQMQRKERKQKKNGKENCQ